jgi:hypothetical protein
MRDKEALFKKLLVINSKILQLTIEDKSQAKKLLVDAADITDSFNKAKQPNGIKELDLNHHEIEQLKTILDQIWESAAANDIEVWPKPDIVTKIG